MQTELQCALTVRDRLAEKLTAAEQEALTLRGSEAEMRAKAEREVQAAELLRIRIDSTEQLQSEMRLQQSQMQQELQVAQAERDQLAKTVEDGLARETAQQAELVQLGGKLEVLQTELVARSSLLGTASDEAKRLSQEKRELEVAFNSYQDHHGLSEHQQLQVIARLKQQVDKLAKQIEATEMELGAEQGSTAELQARNASLRQQLGAAELQRMELHNSIQELKGNIRVYCRVRPAAPGAEVALFQPEPNKMVLSHGLENHADRKSVV